MQASVDEVFEVKMLVLHPFHLHMWTFCGVLTDNFRQECIHMQQQKHK